MLQLVEKLMKEAKEIDQERKKEQAEPEDDELMASENTSTRFSPEMIEEYHKDFMRITEKGIEEYKECPPKNWFKDGKNLCQRLHDDPNSYLLFLEDDRVDYTNNTAEQKARMVKRKLASCMEFRGFLNVIAYSESMSVIEMLRATELPVFEAMTEIFRRPSKAVDKLRLQKEHLTALQTILTMDSDTKDRDEKKLKELREELQQTKAEYKLATQTYTDTFNQRIRNKGEESEPDEEEKTLKKVMDCKEHRVFNLELEVKKAEKNCEFNNKHFDSTQKLIDETKKEIEKLEKKTLSEAESKVQEKAPKQLPCVEASALEAALKDVADKNAHFKEAQEKLKEAREAYTSEVVHPKDCCEAEIRVESVLQGEKIEASLQERKAKARSALEAANQELQNAVSELETAKKNLDAVKKGYKVSA